MGKWNVFSQSMNIVIMHPIWDICVPSPNIENTKVLLGKTNSCAWSMNIPINHLTDASVSMSNTENIAPGHVRNDVPNLISCNSSWHLNHNEMDKNILIGKWTTRLILLKTWLLLWFILSEQKLQIKFLCLKHEHFNQSFLLTHQCQCLI